MISRPIVVALSLFTSFAIAADEPKKEQPQKKEQAQIVGTALSPDGKLLATYRNDGTVKLWNVSDGKPVEGWAGKGKPAAERALLTVSNDGKVVVAYVAGGIDKSPGPAVPPDGDPQWAEVRLHDFATGQTHVLAREAWPSLVPGDPKYSLVALSADAKTLLIGAVERGGSQKVMSIDTAKGKSQVCGRGLADELQKPGK